MKSESLEEADASRRRPMINDGKTCEGCVYGDRDSDGDTRCRAPNDKGAYVFLGQFCDHFAPNLQYRQTVALETIANHLKWWVWQEA